MISDSCQVVARALCEKHIRTVRKWDTDPEVLLKMLPGAIEQHWKEQVPMAEIAIAAYKKYKKTKRKAKNDEG